MCEVRPWWAAREGLAPCFSPFPGGRSGGPPWPGHPSDTIYYIVYYIVYHIGYVIGLIIEPIIGLLVGRIVGPIIARLAFPT